MTIDLSLTNQALYEGCTITEVAGRLNLTTPVEEAVNIIGKNALKIVASATDRHEVTLTGAMAVWTYMIVFHCCVHSFNAVYYNDGRNPRVLIAAHG